MIRKNASLLISYLLVILFVYAGLTKLLDYHHFKASLNSSFLIGSYADIIAWLLPVTEFILSAFLLYTPIRLWGFYASTLLLLIFSVYILLMLTSSHEVPCACGGVFPLMAWMGQLKINILFLLLTATGIWLQIKENQSLMKLKLLTLRKKT
jgi:uncharacterized membrane protein YphA (DoxX/SURF4 family)